MDQSWWIDALRWALFPVLMTLVMGGIAASRSGARQPGTLRQPLSVLLVGATCTLFFGGLLYAGNTFAYNETMTLWVSATFAGFALLGVALSWIYVIDRHTFSESELTFTTIFGARKSIQFSEVVRLTHPLFLNWFHLEDHQGTAARMSVNLIGLPDFATTVLRHVPPSAIDAHTREELQAASEGRLPSI